MRKTKHTEELCSRTIKAGHRVYFVDAKVDSRGSRFVAISEVRGGQEGGGGRERHRIHIYEEDMPRFLDAMGDALTALAEDRKAQEGELSLPVEEHTAEVLGLSQPTQVDIPALDDILSKEEDNID